MAIPSLQIASQGLLSNIVPTLLEIATQGLLDSGVPAVESGPGAWVNWHDRYRRAHEELAESLRRKRPRRQEMPSIIPAHTVFPSPPPQPSASPTKHAPASPRPAVGRAVTHSAGTKSVSLSDYGVRSSPNRPVYVPVPTRWAKPLHALSFPSVPRLATPAIPAVEPERFNAMTAAILGYATRR